VAGCNTCPSDSVSLEDSMAPRFRSILWIALIANSAMFCVEIVASWRSDSMALQADALDFFGDAANYGISLFVLGMALQRRACAAMFKGITMGAFGLWVVSSAVERAVSGSTPDPYTMGGIAALALLVNVGVAVLLYAYRTGDSNTRSIWLCSRNDAIGNVAVMLAATGVFAIGSRWPDLLVAVLIAGLSLSAAVQVIRQAFSELQTSRLPEREARMPAIVENRL
jgi:cation diffusion facilitator family transporter